MKLTKKDAAAVARKSPSELAALARTAKSDAYYAYLDGKNARARELQEKANYLATLSIKVTP